ncbi:nucleotide disphospho-sugar-binding domain-containing protein [Cryptosporangium sp. NPDC048952]|uniref:nucleotide disphospho-sugar-binding domain-containing protein n=1 Tax=Cryptosporangium sp. NPDC048952 TaxID=3363961 RepID=UPI00371DDD51
MKALFTTFPAYGHLLPMLPLARAVAAAGDSVVIAAHRDLHGTAPELTMRDAGPGLPALLAENSARFSEDVLEYRSDTEGDGVLAATVALFSTTYADLAFDERLELVTDSQPDVIVCEMWDFVTPLVAQKLGVPYVTFTHSPATVIDPVLAAGAEKAGAQRGLRVPSPLATVQLWPEWLETLPVSADSRLAVRSSAYDVSARVDLPAFSGSRPVVLVTLGTVVEDLELLRSAVRAVLSAGADALVTTGFTATPTMLETGALEADASRVRAVSFAPIGQLLDRVQAVVAAGGSGTTLAALSRGLPMLFVPKIANQPQVAAAVTEFGAGLTPGSPAEGVPRLLSDANLRARAAEARALLAERPSPEDVWSELRTRLG